MQDYIPGKRDSSLTMEHSKSFISLSSSFSSAPETGYASSEPSASASSVMISPPGGSSNGGQADNTLSGESSEQSGSVLKEHDYIGLAEVSSAAAAVKELLHKEADCVPTDLNLEETDLRLGLGPVKKNDAEAKESDKQKQDAAKSVADAAQRLPVLPTSGRTIGGLVVEGAASQELVNIWQNPNAKSIAAAGHGFQPSHICMPVPDHVEATAVSTPRGSTTNNFEAAKFVVPTPKNGIKRGYMEAMSDALRYAATVESRPSVAGNSTGAGSGPVRSGDSDLKAFSKHQQAGFLSNWTPTKPVVPSTWPVGLDQPSANYNASKLPSMLPHVDKPNDSSAVPYKTPEESISNDAPPAKGAVIGWPPIRSYRKNTLAKPAELFVKVNMDGITVGRKVDLNAHTSYDGLLSALEDMFQPSNSGQGASQVTGRESISNDGKHFRLRNSSEYVLTYEDKDGDWMLVGDVPWSMFVNTVRRLRIMRGSESSSLVLRGPEKPKCLT